MKTRTRNIFACAGIFLLLLALLAGASGCATIKGTIHPEDSPGFTINLVFGPVGESKEEFPLAGAVQSGPFIVEDLEVRNDADVLGVLTAAGISLGGGDITVRNAVVTNTLGVSGTTTLEDDLILENGERIGNDDDNIILLTTENLRVGVSNTFPTDQVPNTIAGGGSNTIFSKWGFIGGGSNNTITGTVANDDARWSFIGGGSSNVITLTEDLGTIVGGVSNQLYGGAAYGFIGGGYENTITGTVNSGGICAGSTNVITDSFGFIGGGYYNQVGGAYATVPGGMNNEAIGDYSFAAGRRAKAMSSGSTVFADGTDADYEDGGVNTFSVRATNGAYFSHAMDVGGVLQYGTDDLYPLGFGSDGYQTVQGVEAVTGTAALVHGLTTPDHCLCTLRDDPGTGAGDCVACSCALSGSVVTLKTWQDDWTAGGNACNIWWQVTGVP